MQLECYLHIDSVEHKGNIARVFQKGSGSHVLRCHLHLFFFIFFLFFINVYLSLSNFRFFTEDDDDDDEDEQGDKNGVRSGFHTCPGNSLVKD